MHINNLFDKKQKILITGAAGWLGRECIGLLQKSFGNEFLDENCVLAGSYERSEIFNGQILKIQQIEDIATSQLAFDYIIHLAFLTRGVFDQTTFEEYRRMNKHIREVCESIVLNSYKPRLLLASSGAAAETNLMRTKGYSYQIYSEEKLLDENYYSDLISNFGGTLGICRIYSLTGTEMLKPNHFAIGDFVLQALRTNEIVIKTTLRSYRRYVDAKDFFSIALSRLAYENYTMDSGGFLLDLFELAKLVTQTINPEATVISNLDTRSVLVDNYYSTSNVFEDVAKSLGQSLADMNQQILNVEIAVNRWLKTNQ